MSELVTKLIRPIGKKSYIIIQQVAEEMQIGVQFHKTFYLHAPVKRVDNKRIRQCTLVIRDPQVRAKLGWGLIVFGV